MRAISLVTAGLVAGLWACAPEAEYEGEMETEPATEVEGELPSTEAPRSSIGEYDTDADQRLTREEFGAWHEGRSADVGDGWDRARFGERVVAVWDTDADERVSEQEWSSGTTTFYANDDVGVWSDWDGDGDSELDANEVAEALETRGLYDRVDLDHDALIDDEELADWFFDLIDLDDDAEIDTTEWDSAMTSGYYGGW